ncbi:DUF6789 family protein [Haloplanus sp. C73]|uniref:DUF6789 family protein n=1 Tax=Haloplanus sp. C73 TaxID=3421641 RepID=UPI003EC0EEB2
MTDTRIQTGFAWGIVATLVMSIPMVAGVVTGVAPMPRPIPEALVSLVLGDAPKPLRMGLALAAHLLYGGVFGVVFARLDRPASLRNGLGFGVLLWFGMGVVVLPLLGWGVFGTALTPKIAVATLGLHLVYGGTLGWALGRETRGRSRSVSSASN